MSLPLVRPSRPPFALNFSLAAVVYTAAVEPPACSGPPLRLLAILEAYSITGPAKNLLEFARLAPAFGIHTTIATFTRDSAPTLFTETARSLGVPVELIPERGPLDSSVPHSLHALAQRLQPHIIQSHAVKSHFLARRAALPSLAPWVAFHHGYTWPDLKARFYNQFDRWSLPAAPKVLTVSQPFRDELISRGVPTSRIEIVHNAIRLDWGASQPDAAARLRAQLNIAPDKKVILIVGRLSREKDHLSLLRAVHQLPAALAPHLLIVGDGPERPRIEELIGQLNLSSSVTLAGHQNSAEPFYAIADLAVLSSLSEGSPNALLEAMVTSVPAVATSVGGIPEIVTHDESALLVQPRDVAALSAAMTRILSDPDLARRLVTRAQSLIRERHTPEARVSRLAGIYRALLGA